MNADVRSAFGKHEASAVVKLPLFRLPLRHVSLIATKQVHPESSG